jgi:biopolymer transport protein ExbD
VKLDLPVNSDQTPPPPVDPVKNKIVITPQGQVLWNGQALDLVQLRQNLDYTQTMSPIPELHLQPDQNARYELVDEVLAVTKRAAVEKMGFVGNEAYMNAF